MSDNIFKPESMSDLSYTQTQMYMRAFSARQDVREVIKPISVLAAINNAKPTRVIIRKNGKIVSDVTGYKNA